MSEATTGELLMLAIMIVGFVAVWGYGLLVLFTKVGGFDEKSEGSDRGRPEGYWPDDFKS